MIESIKLSEQELDICFKTMRKGNSEIKRLAKMTGMEDRKFRAKLFKHETGGWSDEQLEQIVQVLPAIQAVRDIEWKMMCQFSQLARKLANSWSKKIGINDARDYLQEALMALLDAIYAYTDEDTQFITFAWWAISNRLTTAANKDNPFSPLTNEAMGLLKRYEEAKISLNRHATDQDIYDVCGFSEDECRTLRDAQVKVFNASSIERRPNGLVDLGGEETFDYTANRSGIDHESEIVHSYEVHDIVKCANLTKMERRVIEASLESSHHGWQSDFAKNTICKSTGQPYTRQRIMQIYQCALEKIKVAKSRRAVA